MPELNRETTRGFAGSERYIAPPRQPIESRSVPTVNTDYESVVSSRYIAPVREPLQRVSAPRSLAMEVQTIATNNQTTSPPQTPFANAFSDFLSGGRQYDQPIAVVPGDSGSGSSATGLLIVLGIVGIILTYYFYKKHHSSGS
jgi:hypothetical protein